MTIKNLPLNYQERKPESGWRLYKLNDLRVEKNLQLNVFDSRNIWQVNKADFGCPRFRTHNRGEWGT